MWKLKNVWSKKVKYNLGALLDLFTYAMFWLGLVGFAFNSMTAYTIWVKPLLSGIIPEFTLLWFILGVIVFVGVLMVFELLVLYKARQYFRNKWEYEQGSLYRKDLDELKEGQQKIIERICKDD